MADFLTKLAERTLGLALTAQPIIAPIFAPGPDMAGDYDDYSSDSAGLSLDTPAQVSVQVDESSDNWNSGQPSTPDRETLPALSQSDLMSPNLVTNRMTKSDPLSATTRQLASKTPDTQSHSDQGHDPDPEPYNYPNPNPKSEPSSPLVQAETRSLDTHLDIHDVHIHMVTEQDGPSDSFSTTSSQFAHKTPDIHIHPDPHYHSNMKIALDFHDPWRRGDVCVAPTCAPSVPDEATIPGAMTKKDNKKDDLVVFRPTPISHLVPSEDSLSRQGFTDGAPVHPEILSVRNLSEQKRSASQVLKPDSDTSDLPDSPDSRQPDIPESKSALTHIRRTLVPGVIRPQLSDHLESMASMAPILAGQGVAASGSSSSTTRSTTTIRVIIGRIEVRAMLPPPPKLPPQRISPPAPKLSLDDYLRSRNGGKR